MIQEVGLESEQDSPVVKEKKGIKSLFTSLFSNPVVVKELRGRMRGRRAFVVLTIYLLMVSCFASLLFYIYASAAQQPYGPDSYLVGKIVFGGVVGMQLLLVIFITPSFTAGAISSEKEKQTYDLLRTTLLSAPEMVTGKLISALSYMVMLILAAIPLESMAFMLGGVTWEEIIVSQLVLLVTIFVLGAVSLYFSSRMKSTLLATVLSSAFAFLITGGLPVLFIVIVPFFGITGMGAYGVQDPHWLVEMAYYYIGGFLASTNPIVTLILSEVVLIGEQTIFFFKVPFSTSIIQGAPPDIWLISPWIVYVLFYVIIGWLAYRLCVRNVRRQDR
ncbi:MAG: hypothetical protein JXA42_09105 [Anaerolineales bacterium]|nr:hypothetical protein [Anaerolineales bacterium]